MQIHLQQMVFKAVKVFTFLLVSKQEYKVKLWASLWVLISKIRNCHGYPIKHTVTSQAAIWLCSGENISDDSRLLCEYRGEGISYRARSSSKESRDGKSWFKGLFLFSFPVPGTAKAKTAPHTVVIYFSSVAFPSLSLQGDTSWTTLQLLIVSISIIFSPLHQECLLPDVYQTSSTLNFFSVCN